MRSPVIEAPEFLRDTVLGALRIFEDNSLEGAKITVVQDGPRVFAEVKGQNGSTRGEAEDVFVGDSRWEKEDLERRPFQLAKTALMKAIAEYLGENLYWGSLEGVRPGRLYRSIRERGFAETEAELILSSVHGVTRQKTDLLQNLFDKQNRLVGGNEKDAISLYVGIPFCPTRCSYCSFAAYPMKTHGHLKKEFLPALFFELEAMKSFFESNHLTVKSIYIGGGTPTSLTATELAEVLARLPETDELTVEAGRPDTIDQDKLEIFNKAGVDRVSVNPQTLNEKTLRLIGRDHTVEQFFAAVEEVRKANIPILNVDLIAGLPGENAGDMQDTVERIMELQPENVTVHTLALKRASSWYKDFKKWPLPSSKVTERMVEEAQTRLFSSGLLPYYMYRQREMAANLENIGYAKAGAECYYNIVMIEELQTVVGVGAGATTRFVGETISRVVNPKCPSTYAKRVDELIREKREYLAQLLGLVN
ncbi:MAG: coproporphyrinogen dehydrogenase HemZ [Firmicutes bacterium]|jgi:oxygen-independent coproporphyrinogen-3 oxidase|nr:coproporphyrinogen dehydrogenase HemZ [Bacillota bacterium]